MAQISVVVPVYKVEEYIERCVYSILKQTFVDFELILVDDGSPDKCPEICDEFEKQDTRIHVIHQKNQGLSGARNSGIEWAIENSDSKWITFVDSDDWIHPQYLEALRNAAISLQCDIAMCHFKIVETYSDKFLIYDKFDYKAIAVEEIYEDERYIANGANAKLYKKQLFSEVRYPLGKLHEDRFTTYKLLFQYEKVAAVNMPLFFYYINMNGIIHSKWSLRRLDNLEAAEEQIAFFKEKGLVRSYKYTMREYIHLMVCSLREMKKYSEDKKYVVASRKVRKKLRQMIKDYGKELDVSFPKDLTIFKYAYPLCVKIYIRLKEMFKIG